MTVPVHVAVAVKVQVHDQDHDHVYEGVGLSWFPPRIIRKPIRGMTEIRSGCCIDAVVVLVVVLVVDLNFDGDGDVNWDGHALTLWTRARSFR